MNNMVPRYVEQETLKHYCLHFDENGDKYSEFFDILMNSLLEFAFGTIFKVR